MKIIIIVILTMTSNYFRDIFKSGNLSPAETLKIFINSKCMMVLQLQHSTIMFHI